MQGSCFYLGRHASTRRVQSILQQEVCRASRYGILSCSWGYGPHTRHLVQEVKFLEAGLRYGDVGLRARVDGGYFFMAEALGCGDIVEVPDQIFRESIGICRGHGLHSEVAWFMQGHQIEGVAPSHRHLRLSGSQKHTFMGFRSQNPFKDRLH